MSTKTPPSMGSKDENFEDKLPQMNGTFDDMLTPELLYKMNKKIAQLTKVVYGLNTKGEELEGQLQGAKDGEEKAKALNVDLQHRVNAFKTKIENEMSKLRELEAQATQAQRWKVECENLKRRLETESGPEVSSIALNHARDEVEQLRRREATMQFDLDQARHAINNLKAHHDFIMRERDTQQAMEREKIVLEWQTRISEIESRYKAQTRRVTDDMDTLRSECEILRGRARRASSMAGEEATLREQIRMLQMKHDTERREWEMKLKRQADIESEKLKKLTESNMELRRNLRPRSEENGEAINALEERIRSSKESYEERIRDLTANQEMLQRLIDDKEVEFETRLKAKVVEWKTEWDLAEEGLRDEIRKLRNENLKLQTEVTSLRFSMDNADLTFISRIQKLEEEVEDKQGELERNTKNFKAQMDKVTNEKESLLQDKVALERRLESEREILKGKLKELGGAEERKRSELEGKIARLLDAEKHWKSKTAEMANENESLRNEKERTVKANKEMEKEWSQKLEVELNKMETKIKQKVERIWIDKLKKTEESANHDLERVQDALKRREASLQREIEVAKNSEEEMKSINEELRQKLKDIRSKEAEKNTLIKGLEDRMEEIRKRNGRSSSGMKELSDQEEKYQNQVDDLTLKLAEKQKEVQDLVEELNKVKDQGHGQGQSQVQGQSPSRNLRGDDLEIQIEDMKKQVKLKENMAESVSVELQYAKNENEIFRLKLQRLEEDLSTTKGLVQSLKEQNATATKECSRLKEMESKLRKVEEELKKSESTKKDLEKSLNVSESEREEELKIVQDALEEAAQEREELITTFEKELKHLNTTNTAREQQMLEDFEWKLREMEKGNKKKLDEKEMQLQASLNAVRSVVESELADSITKIAEDRRIADAKLAEVGHLRSYEAEAIQLRGVTHEFQKALRASAREIENQKIRERLLEEEIRSLKTGSQSRQNTLQRVKCRNDDEEFRQKLEKMKSEMNAKWEDKLRSECARLKSELDELHSEEKHLAVESMKVQKEQEIQALKKSWELNQEEMTKEISTLKDTLTNKDAYYHNEMETIRTNADRDVWDLRMKLQRLNESSFDKLQQQEEKYRDELERCRADYDDRIRELEARIAAQEEESGSELLAQLEREHKSQMHHVGEQHKISMERLREEHEADKFQEVEDARVIITKHHAQVESNLKEQINEYLSTIVQCREELENLRKTLSRRDESLRTLKEEFEKLQESKGVADPLSGVTAPSNISPSSSGLSSSQFSLASSSDSQGSRTSQDRFSVPENGGAVDSSDESQKSSNSGILGKVFGGGWFAPAKGNRRSSTPISNKKGYGS